MKLKCKYTKTSKFNVVDSIVQELGRACQGTEVLLLLLAHWSNYGRMPFLPSPMTHMGTNEN